MLHAIGRKRLRENCMPVGFRPRRALRALFDLDQSLPAAGPHAPADLKAAYVQHVEALKQTLPHDQAMEHAIGGGFELIGGIEAALVRRYGLEGGGYLVDVGCGSGRLAKPLASDPAVRYLGFDLVPDLVAHAHTICARPDWRFEVIDHIEIPEAADLADVVAFFSVLTHLTHEQGYWYLEEARRVLRPGGHIVFSFLEFQEPAHWANFDVVLNAAKARAGVHMNVFHDRAFLPVWAKRLGLDLVAMHSGRDAVVPEGNLGQALCVLRKPA